MTRTAFVPVCVPSQKSRNLVLVEMETSTGRRLVWVIIDLDASSAIGSLAGQKITSSACYPPEMARGELAKAAPLTRAADLTATVAEKKTQLDVAMQRHESDVVASLAFERKKLEAELKHVGGTVGAEPVKASIQFEMWYFGTYQRSSLCLHQYSRNVHF